MSLLFYPNTLNILTDKETKKTGLFDDEKKNVIDIVVIVGD